MKYRVELIFIDENDESQDLSYFTYVEAGNREEAVEAAKQKQSAQAPELKAGQRWAWFAYETAEDEGGQPERSSATHLDEQ